MVAVLARQAVFFWGVYAFASRVLFASARCVFLLLRSCWVGVGLDCDVLLMHCFWALESRRCV